MAEAPVRHGWFGDPDRPLFGALHVPAGHRAVAGVVLCPPVGKEQGDTTRGSKLLAERLAEQGVLVLRYDHRGTGESWGRQADPGAGDLVAGLREALALVRAAGVPRVGVVGLRVGALAAASLPAEELAGLDALVLWEPVHRGRSWLRAEKALYAVALGSPAPAGVAATSAPDRPGDGADLVHLVGATWHRDAVARIAALSVPDDLPARVRVAVAAHDGEPAASLVLAGADLLPLPDQSGFVKPGSYLVDLPAAAVERVASWLTTVLDGEAAAVTPVDLAGAMREDGPRGGSVTRVDVAPGGVVRWTTEPGRGAVRRLLLAHATANDVRTGPARLWVETARDLAEEGVRTVRHDRLGVGESGPVHPVDDYSPLHARAAVADAQQATALLREGGHDRTPLVHAGVCSGGWVAANVAHAAPTAGTRLVLVNQLMWRLRTHPFRRDQLAAMGVTVAGGQPAGRWVRLRDRLQPLVSRVLPHPAWLVLGRLRLAQVPELLLARLADDGLETRVVLSPPDAELFERQHGRLTLERLGARPGADVRLLVAAGGDHPALHPRVREAAAAAVRDALDLDGADPLGVPAAQGSSRAASDRLAAG